MAHKAPVSAAAGARTHADSAQMAVTAASRSTAAEGESVSWHPCLSAKAIVRAGVTLPPMTMTSPSSDTNAAR